MIAHYAVTDAIYHFPTAKPASKVRAAKVRRLAGDLSVVSTQEQGIGVSLAPCETLR